MAAFAESDLTVAELRKEDSNGMVEIDGTVAFGDGALTYATGGVPCSAGKLGFPVEVKSCVFTASSLHYIAEYDIANAKIKLKYLELSAGTDAPPIEVANGAAPAAMTLRYNAKGY
jgi:hypothetical protein